MAALTLRGAGRRVVRIIPVPGTGSKCWLHFAQSGVLVDSQKMSVWQLFTL
jgi:hypothetical protein